MPASTYAANAILNKFMRGVGFAAPARVYVSLHTADPANTGANEVTLAAWPAYVRRDPANAGAVGTGFTAASAKVLFNAIDILWPVHDGAGNITITHVAVWDALTGGNCLFTGALTAARTISPTDEIIVRASQLQFSVV